MQVEGIEVLINRDEIIQTESFDTIQSKYNITWIDACNYRLELIGKSNLDVSENIPIMDVKIYKVSGDTCFTLTTAPGIGFEDKSWMKMVK